MDNILTILTLLFAVGGGLLSLFGKKDEEEETNSSPRPTQSRTQQKPVERPEKTQKPRQSAELQTYFDEKQEQLKQLQSNLGVDPESSQYEQALQKYQELKVKKESKPKTKQRKTAFSVARNISKEGLAESVIMAEVLGPPRAKKPYQQKKYNKQ